MKVIQGCESGMKENGDLKAKYPWFLYHFCINGIK